MVLTSEAYRKLYQHILSYKEQFEDEDWTVRDITDSINANYPELTDGIKITDYYVRAISKRCGLFSREADIFEELSEIKHMLQLLLNGRIERLS